MLLPKVLGQSGTAIPALVLVTNPPMKSNGAVAHTATIAIRASQGRDATKPSASDRVPRITLPNVPMIRPSKVPKSKNPSAINSALGLTATCVAPSANVCEGDSVSLEPSTKSPRTAESAPAPIAVETASLNRPKPGRSPTDQPATASEIAQTPKVIGSATFSCSLSQGRCVTNHADHNATALAKPPTITGERNPHFEGECVDVVSVGIRIEVDCLRIGLADLTRTRFVHYSSPQVLACWWQFVQATKASVIVGQLDHTSLRLRLIYKNGNFRP